MRILDYLIVCILLCSYSLIPRTSLAAPNGNHQPLIYMGLDDLFPDESSRRLAAAAGSGNIKRISEIVRSGIDVNAQGARGATPLFWALRSTNLAGYRHLLLQGGNPNLVAGTMNETPLFETIGVNDGRDLSEDRRLLLSNGADINHPTEGVRFGIDFGGNTPILIAADLARLDIVEELLDLGADCRAKNNLGRDLVTKLQEYVGRFDSTSLGEANERRLHISSIG